MRHGLDFVDLQNPEVRCPPMRLEQRVMIGAEMSRCAPPMNGGVERAAEAGALDHPAVHADSDEATRERVHNHQDPVVPVPERVPSNEIRPPAKYLKRLAELTSRVLQR